MLRLVSRRVNARPRPTSTLPTRAPTACKPTAYTPLWTLGVHEPTHPTQHCGRRPGTGRCAVAHHVNVLFSEAKTSSALPPRGTLAARSPLLAQDVPSALVRRGFATGLTMAAARNRAKGSAIMDILPAVSGKQLLPALGYDSDVSAFLIIEPGQCGGSGTARYENTTSAEASRHHEATCKDARQDETRKERRKKVLALRKAFQSEPHNRSNPHAPRAVPGVDPELGFLVDYTGCVIHPAATHTENPRFAYEMDHIIPWSKGGRSDSSNVVAIHHSANRTKGAKLAVKVSELQKRGVTVDELKKEIAEKRTDESGRPRSNQQLLAAILGAEESAAVSTAQ